MKPIIHFLVVLSFAGSAALSHSSATPESMLAEAELMAKSGKSFEAAKVAFQALEGAEKTRAAAYATIALGLADAGYYHAASYFFIRALQGEDRGAIQKVLKRSGEMIDRVGMDVFRAFLVKHTRASDYDAQNLSIYALALAKTHLLGDDAQGAVRESSRVSSSSSVWPYALQLRASANAILGQSSEALADFRQCSAQAGQVTHRQKSRDLLARCLAGEARTLYQMNRFDESEFAYDRIDKASIVWPDILFEQAWNAFSKYDYNRTLGKLVSYRSPALSFVFNSEVDVLNAHTYLQLCHYRDSFKEVIGFASKYKGVGNLLKNFIEANPTDLAPYYETGKEAVRGSLYTSNVIHRVANRFVRAPTFLDLVQEEREIGDERDVLSARSGRDQKGFEEFLQLVLKWRLKTIRLIGGAFVKNGLMDHYQILISDFEKIGFIHIELLRRAKEQLQVEKISGESRIRGDQEPTRHDYQYYWNFNGEYWTDELGDYVFGLRSQCKDAK